MKREFEIPTLKNKYKKQTLKKKLREAYLFYQDKIFSTVLVTSKDETRFQTDRVVGARQKGYLSLI